MATAAKATPPAIPFATVAELLALLGDVPPERVRLRPAPGTATERDVGEIYERERRRCELVEGILVEKVMGLEESRLASLLLKYLLIFLDTHDLGTAIGPDAAIRLFPGLVRIPDVSYISWERYPKGRRKRGAIPCLAPDLAVEVLSKGNTRKEMARKLEDYFRAGVRLVWYVDPKTRTVTAYTAPDRRTELREGNALDGGDVLPGFALSIRDWFAEAARQGPRA